MNTACALTGENQDRMKRLPRMGAPRSQNELLLHRMWIKIKTIALSKRCEMQKKTYLWSHLLGVLQWENLLHEGRNHNTPPTSPEATMALISFGTPRQREEKVVWIDVHMQTGVFVTKCTPLQSHLRSVFLYCNLHLCVGKGNKKKGITDSIWCW